MTAPRRLKGETMIARIWSGEVEEADAADYDAYMREVALDGYTRIDGNRGVFMLTRTLGGRVEFTMVSLWDSIASIRAFAGKDYEVAVFYPRDDRFLVRRDERVRHHDVAATAGLPL